MRPVDWCLCVLYLTIAAFIAMLTVLMWIHGMFVIRVMAVVSFTAARGTRRLILVRFPHHMLRLFNQPAQTGRQVTSTPHPEQLALLVS